MVRHWSTGPSWERTTFGERTEIVGAVVWTADEDHDLGESRADRGANAPMAGDDDEIGAVLAHHGRLCDAGRLDIGDHLPIGMLAGSDAAGIAGIGLEIARVDMTQFHDDELLFQFELPIFLSKTRIERPDRGRRGKSARHARERSDALLRRRRAWGRSPFIVILIFVFVLLGARLSSTIDGRRPATHSEKSNSEPWRRIGGGAAAGDVGPESASDRGIGSYLAFRRSNNSRSRRAMSL